MAKPRNQPSRKGLTNSGHEKIFHRSATAVRHCIMNSALGRWLQYQPKIRQLLWFVALWLGGLLVAIILSAPIKLLIKLMSD
ncbi:MAG: hypothetical protein ORN57_01145 [Alphaproteobacteria bacterium]|nr:hypothetical protein [Alphaproteobacteria bacterium]